jgi:hypothetical protein
MGRVRVSAVPIYRGAVGGGPLPFACFMLPFFKVSRQSLLAFC